MSKQQPGTPEEIKKSLAGMNLETLQSTTNEHLGRTLEVLTKIAESSKRSTDERFKAAQMVQNFAVLIVMADLAKEVNGMEGDSRRQMINTIGGMIDKQDS